MRKIIFITFIILSLSAIIGSIWLFSKYPSAEQIAQAFPNNSAEIFNSGDKLILFSLQPEGKSFDAEDFHGYKVLKQTEIKEESFQKLIKNTFLKSLTDRNESAKCFEQRHGLRILRESSTLDLVICFECRNFVR